MPTLLAEVGLAVATGCSVGVGPGPGGSVSNEVTVVPCIFCGTWAVSELSHGTVKHETWRVRHCTAPFNRQAAGDRYVELTGRVAQWS